MSEPRRCLACGVEIRPTSPSGMCPRCLLEAGVESQGPSSPGLQPTQASPAGAPFVPPTPADLARYFPQLEVLELLGVGGMGAVYKARQPGLDRFVAIKIMSPEVSHDPAFAERFSREARALARLSHPNIVSVFDFGKTEGLYYFVMDYVDGLNLRQAIRAGQLSPTDALAIVSQVCEALQFAHDEGVVHRDIKPENILIDKKGRVKIADFGLAKLVGQDAGDHVLTGTHQVMGTVRYMAPEQMEGSHEVDHRADIYSLGVVFYELLTGELPLGRFAPPSKKVQIDVRLDEVVLRALEKEPELRYQHASELKTEMEGIRGVAPIALQRAFGTEYRSKTTLFGVPLVHIAYGLDPKTGRKRVAKGIIALGDVAIGVFASGGVAVGGIAFGGVSLGFFSLGGLALGLMLAVGGLAIGPLAFGGGAVGGVALGGGAIGYYAGGGGGWGVHSVFGEHQDPEALAFFNDWATNWPRWIVWLALGIPLANVLTFAFVWYLMRSQNLPPQSKAAEASPSTPAVAVAPTASKVSLSRTYWKTLGWSALAWWLVPLLWNARGWGLLVACLAIGVLMVWLSHRAGQQLPETREQWRRSSSAMRWFNVAASTVLAAAGAWLLVVGFFQGWERTRWSRWALTEEEFVQKYQGVEHRLLRVLPAYAKDIPRAELVLSGARWSSGLMLSPTAIPSVRYFSPWGACALILLGALLIWGTCLAMLSNNPKSWLWIGWGNYGWPSVAMALLIVLPLIPYSFVLFIVSISNAIFVGDFASESVRVPSDLKTVVERMQGWAGEHGFVEGDFAAWHIQSVPGDKRLATADIRQLWRPNMFDRWQMTSHGLVRISPHLVMQSVADEQTKETVVQLTMNANMKGSPENAPLMETYQSLVAALEQKEQKP